MRNPVSWGDPFAVVALAGESGVGKDTVADAALIPLGFHRIGLADHAKVALVAGGEATYREVFVTKPPRVRDLLQRRLEAAREALPAFHVGAAYGWMQLLHDRQGVARFVVPDLRHPEDIAYLQARGAVVYRVVAPARRAANALTPAQRAHRSEALLDGLPEYAFDGVVYNDPGDPDPARQVHGLLRAHGLWPSGVAA
jgi:hypothetical protein